MLSLITEDGMRAIGLLGIPLIGFALAASCGGGGDDGSACGDGVCDIGESATTCAIDCPAGPRCGDGICNGSETAASCAPDCAATACTASPDNCGGETICIAGKCEAAFPRVYQIRNVSVTVPTTNQGADWDAGGGAPDLFLAKTDGTPLTSAVQDMFSASFAGPFEFSLIAGATLRIDVWDEDISVNDYATGCERAPITAAQLRTRTFNCAGSGITFTSTINPK